MNIYQELNKLLDEKILSPEQYGILVSKLREFRHVITESESINQWENQVIKTIEIPIYVVQKGGALSTTDNLNIQYNTDILIEKAFKQCKTQREMAKVLGISERTLYRNLKYQQLSKNK